MSGSEQESIIPWQDEPDWNDGTSPPPDDGFQIPADSPAVLAAVVIGVLAAVSLLFSFALLIDCRNQEAEAAKKQSGASRMKRRVFRLSQFFRGRSANGDGLAFASQVCEENRDTTPASVHVTEPSTSTSNGPC